MKKILLIVGVLLVIIICLIIYNIPSKKEIENEIKLQDSIKNELTTSQKDSIDKVEKYKSTSHIAYDKVTFGMTEKEYEKIYKSYINDVEGVSYMFAPRYDDNGKLYLLEMNGFYRTANYIDGELNDDMKSLAGLITRKYEIPSYFSEISFFDFKPGYIQWFAIWDLGSKIIKLGMSEKDTGSQYRVICWIYDKNLEATQREINETEKAKLNTVESSKF